MTEVFPPEVRFQGDWRPYQARVLSELEAHMEDDKLHVVAAPGSGKTILGLEVLRRIDQPTLVLAPTLAIRDQWVDRFLSWFLPEGFGRPSWISTDLRRPGRLTVVTYQALHMATLGRYLEEEVELEEEVPEEEYEAVLKARQRAAGIAEVAMALQAAGVRTVVVDEAHHLRSDWWDSLVRVTGRMCGPVIVALTATPPYDSTPVEWDRYTSLCGPIDAEISVPELVNVGNLCYHQDYVILSTPTDEERAMIRRFREDVRRFVEELKADQRFIRAIAFHRWMRDPEGNAEEILSEPELASSMAVFLGGVGRTVPEGLVRVMGVERQRLPALDDQWLEVLLTGCLFRRAEDFEYDLEHLEGLRRRLTRIGSVERGRAHLRSTDRIGKVLATSLNKLESIVDVVRLEQGVLGNDLRMVILTDFIYRSMMPRHPEDHVELKRIGVVPIFEVIRRASPGGVRLGVLTGSIVVIPAGAADALRAVAEEMGMSPSDVRLRSLHHDPGFLSVELAGGGTHSSVQLLTRLFNRGHVNVLVGTKSLLGEGWDAPSINTLVLATFVGAYMLSNQMRGRAIRSLPGFPEKTANIWHLVCVEEGEEDPGLDMGTMERRFKAFVGLATGDGDLIENGIERLCLPEAPMDRQAIEVANEWTEDMARDRPALVEGWRSALELSTDARMVYQLRAPDTFLRTGFVFYNTIEMLAYVTLILCGSFMVIFAEYLVMGLLGGPSLGVALFTLGWIVVIQVVFFGQVIWLTIRYGPVATCLHQIARALLESLVEVREVRTPMKKLWLRVRKGEHGEVYCSLDGATYHETQLFLDSLQEILEHIANPRYIMARYSVLGRWHRRDYHAVPKVLGVNKDRAETFARKWRRHVGSCDLVFTRTVEGRQVLLRARQDSLAAHFVDRSERVNRWS